MLEYLPFNMTLEKDLEHPVKRRAGYKSHVTIELKKLEEVPIEDLTSVSFLRSQESISSYLEKIEEANVAILDVFIVYDIRDDDDGKVKEIGLLVLLSAYMIKIILLLLLPMYPVVRILLNYLALNTQDKMAFKNFLQQFHNCINVCGQLSDSSKLTYLRGYLKGYAFRVISRLSVSDDDYSVALISKLPKFDLSFTDVCCFINDCRSMLHELKVYGVDLLDGGSARCKLMSHIIFLKLPPIC